MNDSEQMARLLAPTGTLRVGVLMVSYFAVEDAAGGLTGVIPDLGTELARRASVPVELLPYKKPAALVEAFRDRAVDITFVGITADRAAVMDFGSLVLELRTTYLVAAASPIRQIADVDQPGIRILVPQRSAQEAYLKRTLKHAITISVAVETPKPALDMLMARAAEVFSHVVPMLAVAQPLLPGSRILPGSYYNVPIAIGLAKGRPPTVADWCREFARDVKQSGLAQRAIERAGIKGVVVEGSAQHAQ
jgi:polar amino acid transport system substrate-binding protein